MQSLLLGDVQLRVVADGRYFNDSYASAGWSERRAHVGAIPPDPTTQHSKFTTDVILHHRIFFLRDTSERARPGRSLHARPTLSEVRCCYLVWVICALFERLPLAASDSHSLQSGTGYMEQLDQRYLCKGQCMEASR